MTLPAELPTTWRTRAELMRAHGAEGQARTLEAVAAELEAAIGEAADEVLTLAEAARESGYSERMLRQYMTDGTVPNVGRKGAPRIRRADLPRKASKSAGGSTYDPQEHARAILGKRGDGRAA